MIKLEKDKFYPNIWEIVIETEEDYYALINYGILIGEYIYPFKYYSHTRMLKGRRYPVHFSAAGLFSTKSHNQIPYDIPVIQEYIKIQDGNK